MASGPAMSTRAASAAQATDDWKQNRQTCVDVLCAFLRLPYDPDPGENATPAERAAYRAKREVRHTVIRVITAHLKDGAAVSWQGLDFDFTGVVFDGGDFSDARFSGGWIRFSGAEFSGSRATLSGTVDFENAVFSGSTVDFEYAVFSGSRVSFVGAVFSGGEVLFSNAKFSGGEVVLGGAVFSGGTVDFSGAEFSGGTVDFRRAKFSGSRVSFLEAKRWSHPPTFSWDGKPPTGGRATGSAVQEKKEGRALARLTSADRARRLGNNDTRSSSAPRPAAPRRAPQLSCPVEGCERTAL